MLVLGLLLFVLMAMMGGLAVDLMRDERRRTEVQQTQDRAVLAAAAVSQKRAAQAVVTDYFAKAGLSQYLKQVGVEDFANYKRVTADASFTTPTFFMHMMGVDEIANKTGAIAEQRVNNIEVSLVLDISGSMQGSRINNLRPAAKEFVTAVLAASKPGRVSISIIPYNAQVNLGRPLMSQFNVTPNHDQASCIELPDSVFNSIDVSTITTFKHNAHFDPWGGGKNPGRRNCNAGAASEVITLSKNEGKMHSLIDGLVADGYTSIDLGVKWGAYLLNRNANPVIQSLVTADEVEQVFSDRPMVAEPDKVLKVLVVMTDGDNTEEYKIKDPYNTGMSSIWRNSSGTISVNFDISAKTNDWYWPRTKEWKTSKDTGKKGRETGYEQLTWQAVWDSYPVSYVAQTLYADAKGNSKDYWRGVFMTGTFATAKDTRMQKICTAAKNSGITVYGIAFEAPWRGRTQLLACASSPSHYFDANGLEISSAFRAIATDISQLRLVK